MGVRYWKLGGALKSEKQIPHMRDAIYYKSWKGAKWNLDSHYMYHEESCLALLLAFRCTVS